MIYWYAFILGILQGIAEFLPISSSGHITLGAGLLDESLQNVEFNLAVHIGTFGSIVVVYWKKLWTNRFNWRLWSRVVVATLPLVVIGLLFKDSVEAAMENSRAVGFALLLTAAFLAMLRVVEFRDEDGRRLGRSLDEITWFDAIVIGCFQSIAIIPGVSRSGSTIFGGVASGVGRIAAADFSFFIALPAIAGATVLYTKDLLEAGGTGTPASLLVTGGLTAFVVGIVALKLLLALVAKGQLWWFAIYCAILGVGAIIATS